MLLLSSFVLRNNNNNNQIEILNIVNNGVACAGMNSKTMNEFTLFTVHSVRDKYIDVVAD